MSMVLRGKKVRLAAIFEPGKPARPVWFELNRRQHKVLQTTYRWQDRIGEAELLHFTVSDGEALYELIYNLDEQDWTLHAQAAEAP
jgi:hypothetical protein